MILVLRGRPDPVTAPAGLARLDALVAAARSTGQEVVVVGTPPHRCRPPPTRPRSGSCRSR